MLIFLCKFYGLCIRISKLLLSIVTFEGYVYGQAFTSEIQIYTEILLYSIFRIKFPTT